MYSLDAMSMGDRIKSRMEELGLSASAVARLCGVTQPTISRLINGAQYGSTHIVSIARALQTSPAYIMGETDDPDEGAPPPPPEPEVQTVTLDVVLPSLPALEQMFLGILAASEGLSQDELAHELALQLPTALATARSARPSQRRFHRGKAGAGAEGPHDAGQQSARSSRT